MHTGIFETTGILFQDRISIVAFSTGDSSRHRTYYLPDATVSLAWSGNWHFTWQIKLSKWMATMGHWKGYRDRVHIVQPQFNLKGHKNSH